MLSVEGSQSGLPPQLDWEDATEQAPAQPHQICLVKASRLLQLWQPAVRAWTEVCHPHAFPASQQKENIERKMVITIIMFLLFVFQTTLTQEGELNPEKKHFGIQMKNLSTVPHSGNV